MSPGEKLAALLATKATIESGFGGVLSSGEIVDRRQHPNAIPLQENPHLNTPAPKPVDGSDEDGHKEAQNAPKGKRGGGVGAALQLIRAAHYDYQQAAEALIEVVKEQFPIGAIVNVTINRFPVRGRVTGHSDSFWYEPGYVTIENIVTLKLRKFCPYSSSCDAIVVSIGSEEDGHKEAQNAQKGSEVGA